MIKFIYCILLSVCFFSCTENTIVYKTVSSSENNDANENSERIIKKIEVELEVFQEGISSFNSKKIFSVFSNDIGVRYIRENHVYKFLKKAEWDYARMFKDATEESYREMKFVNKEYLIIDQNNVFLTTKGVLGSGDDKWEIMYTILWRRVDLEWKVYNMHISW